MAWSGEFLAAISSPVVTPIYVLETISLGTEPLVPDLFLSSISFHRLPGYQGALAPEMSSISGGTLNVGDWTFSTGQWEIGVDHSAGAGSRTGITRGQAVALKIGFPGWDVSEFQVVALGVVQNIVSRNEKWNIQIRSLLGSLTTRWTETTAQNALFYKLPISTFTTTEFDAVSSTSIVVDNVTNAEKETGSGYILELTPDDGEILYYYSTTLTTKTFSGLTLLFDGDTTLPDGAAKILGDYASTDEKINVRIGALVKDDPASIVRKILTSTGAGTNGAYDTLPASFGIGLSAEHFDDTYFDFAINEITATGSSGEIYAHAFDEEADALAYIHTILAPFAAFLCERQGQISISAMADHLGSPIGNQWALTDSEIVEIGTYETWNSEQAAEAGQVLNTLPSETNGDGEGFHAVIATRSSSEITSRPNVMSRTTHFPYVNGAGDDEWLSETTLRTARWFMQAGESVEIVCRGWRLAAAAPGDHLILTTTHVTGREGIDSLLGKGTPLDIISVDCDWFGSTTRIRAVYLPIVALSVV